MRHLLPNAPLLRAGTLGLAHALLLILAFPPVFLPYVALLIPFPALLAARIDDKPKRAALVFGLATAPAWVFFHRWLIDVTLAGYPFLVLFLCLYGTLFVLCAQRLRRVAPWWIAAPLAWTAVEFFRGQIAFDGYPWYLTAQPLAATIVNDPLAYLGVYGSGLLIALITTGAIVGGVPRGGALMLFMFAGIVCIDFNATPPEARRNGPSIAVIQTNVPQDNKTGWTLEQRLEDFKRFVQLTREAAASPRPPTLIVWPETMYPGVALDPESINAIYRDPRFPHFESALFQLQRDIDIPMLVGAHAYDGFRLEETPRGLMIESDAEYNSAIMIRDGVSEAERYDKLQLTPFGEVMPYISWSDWLESQLLSIGAPGMAFNLDAGTKETVFEVNGIRFATPICFEATMPNVCRRLAYENGERRVDMLVQLTNDGWFGDTAGGRETHLLLARCRAVELGVSVIRAANTGISAVINPEGELNRAADAWTDGVMRGYVEPPVAIGTIYGRYLGDALGWIALAGTFAGIVGSFRKKKLSPDPTPETVE